MSYSDTYSSSSSSPPRLRRRKFFPNDTSSSEASKEIKKSNNVWRTIYCSNGECPYGESLFVSDKQDESDVIEDHDWGDPRNSGYDIILCPTCDDEFEDKCGLQDGDYCRYYSADTSFCKACQERHCVGCGCKFS
eukprot:TRINITY_DN9773_c0_g1_i1.p1 TRINITY_DN9773_c0_g1~~TRINITY_DN9773_c0_g1_i1.p1  ORF type:complete len:135 (-),score=18.11 TRINITY_DN9773_c0_g1_i1:67-471(-)